jgi:hypothetical protein
MQPGIIKLLPTGQTEVTKVGEATIHTPRCTIRMDFKASDVERAVIQRAGAKRILGSLESHGYNLLIEDDTVVVFDSSPKPFDSMLPYSVSLLATTESSTRAHLESFIRLYQQNPDFLTQ